MPAWAWMIEHELDSLRTVWSGKAKQTNSTIFAFNAPNAIP